LQEQHKVLDGLAAGQSSVTQVSDERWEVAFDQMGIPRQDDQVAQGRRLRDTSAGCGHDDRTSNSTTPSIERGEVFLWAGVPRHRLVVVGH
jgi:hypothetical protein